MFVFTIITDPDLDQVVEFQSLHCCDNFRLRKKRCKLHACFFGLVIITLFFFFLLFGDGLIFLLRFLFSCLFSNLLQQPYEFLGSPPTL